MVIGDVVAGKPHIQACQRHLNDLERQGTKTSIYLAAGKIRRNTRICRNADHSGGRKAYSAEIIRLPTLDLGVRLVGITAEGIDALGGRTSPKQGRMAKPLKRNPSGLHCRIWWYNYGKLFTAATKWAQAKLVWEEMMKFIKIDEDLSELFQGARIQNAHNGIEYKLHR